MKTVDHRIKVSLPVNLREEEDVKKHYEAMGYLYFGSIIQDGFAELEFCMVKEVAS